MYEDTPEEFVADVMRRSSSRSTALLRIANHVNTIMMLKTVKITKEFSKKKSSFLLLITKKDRCKRAI